MNKIIRYIYLSLMIVSLSACFPVDNTDEPAETFGGKVINKLTGETVWGGFSIKLEELSWSENPKPFYIPVKPDGSFLNTRLFPGHYRVQTYGDVPFWPSETFEVDIKGSVYQDFHVTPYMLLKNISHKINGNTLTITLKLDPPITKDLPKIMYIQPFVYIGNSSSLIEQYSQQCRVNIDKNWTEEMSDITYEVVIPNMKPNIYRVDVGVRIDVHSDTWVKELVNKKEGEKGMITIE